MEAAVTLKLTPQEFDLLRMALLTHASAQADLARSKEAPPATRREAREQEAQTRLVLDKLR